MRACSTASGSAWIGALCDALNAEVLPEDHFALIEAAGGVPVLNILAEPPSPGPGDAAGPGDQVQGRARAADRIAVRHEDGRIIAFVEILSSEDKASDAALRAFVATMAKAIARGVHVLVVDLFPPGPHDPQGIHKAIWDELEELDFASARRPAADRGVLRLGPDAGELRGAVRRRGHPARDAALPQAGVLRPDAAGGHLPGGLGPLPRRAEGAACGR